MLAATAFANRQNVAIGENLAAGVSLPVFTGRDVRQDSEVRRCRAGIANIIERQTSKALWLDQIASPANSSAMVETWLCALRSIG